MSLVRAIHDFYEREAATRRPPTGWPTGSRLGTCCAQLQWLRIPDKSHPEPLRGRALRVFERGNRAEQWLGEQLRGRFPNLVGFSQEPVFFSVAIDAVQRDELARRINNRTLWGRVFEQFNEPKLYLGDDGRVKARLVPRDPSTEKPVNYGFVVDLDRQLLWVPTYMDWAVNHPTLGLTVVEGKSLSDFSFRRTLLGDPGYQMRCQLVGFARATRANVLLFAERAQTQHLAEVAYTRLTDRTRVTLTKSNGSQEVFFVDPNANKNAPLIPESGGTAQGFPSDLLWDVAETWTPYDTSLEAEIDKRVLDVLLFDGDPASVRREYGASFVCEVCNGTGTQTTRKGSSIPLKTAKPCEDCVGGLRDETELNFPCSYCSCVLSACYPFARLEIDDRPHYRVSRADWEASGLTFVVPEGQR